MHRRILLTTLLLGAGALGAACGGADSVTSETAAASDATVASPAESAASTEQGSITPEQAIMLAVAQSPADPGSAVVAEEVIATNHADAAEQGLAMPNDGNDDSYIVVLSGKFHRPTHSISTTEEEASYAAYATYEVRASDGFVGSSQLDNLKPTFEGDNLLDAPLTETMPSS